MSRPFGGNASPTGGAATAELVARLARCVAPCRQDLWVQIARDIAAHGFMEIGVWTGVFAAHLLGECPAIARYFMVDPWRHLECWNKPFNVDAAAFEAVHAEAMARTAFAGARRVVLRGTTTEVIDRVSDGTLDLVYVDGDHTLRGIAIDLICAYPKLRPGGVLGGDDYTPPIWQHPRQYQPTLGCPFPAYFAHAQGAPPVILPYGQFAIVKPGQPGMHFQVIDTDGAYNERP